MNQRIAHLAVVLLLCMSVSTAARAELAGPASLPVLPSVPSVSSSSRSLLFLTSLHRITVLEYNADLAAETVLATIDVPGEVHGAVGLEGWLYVGRGSDGISIYDISDIKNPRATARLPLNGSVLGVSLEENRLVARLASGVSIFCGLTERPAPACGQPFQAAVVEPAHAAPRAPTPAPPPVPTRTTRRSPTRSRWVWPVVAGSITMAAGLLLVPIGVGIAFIPDEACKGQLDCVGKYVAPGIGTAVGGGGGLLLVGGIITGIGAIGLAATF